MAPVVRSSSTVRSRAGCGGFGRLLSGVLVRVAALAVLVDEVVGGELAATCLARVVVDGGAAAARPLARRRPATPRAVGYAGEAHRPVAGRHVQYSATTLGRFGFDAFHVQLAGRAGGGRRRGRGRGRRRSPGAPRHGPVSPGRGRRPRHARTRPEPRAVQRQHPRFVADDGLSARPRNELYIYDPPKLAN